MMNYTLNQLSKIYADLSKGVEIKTPFADTVEAFKEREAAVLDRLHPQSIADLYLAYLKGITVVSEAAPNHYEALRNDSERPPDAWVKAYTLREKYKYSWVRIGSEIGVTDKTAKTYFDNYLNYLNSKNDEKTEPNPET